MYYHQGPWLKVDRLWTIRADGSHNDLVHQRTLSHEAVGNAFWDSDGNIIWYDLQSPLGRNFSLVGYNVGTKERFRYDIDRNYWSNHYNVAAGGRAFCGDGSDTTGLAAAPDGKWLELFSPHEKTEPVDPSQRDLIQTESFKLRHLVHLSKQRYIVEPNARFSPDHKQVIFTSNMFGPSYIFAVDVARAPHSSTTTDSQ
jgi:oligogalacturonide lyase